ncbi:MAG TPA: glycosyltransferase family 9 protein [Acidimicrobiales bacterium]|nr:glycosyltransferase family 9 protein [Acidimicrobiales bacterium]
MSGGILVARLDNCGDVLLAGPAVRSAAASGRPVHLLCGPRGRAAAEMLPGVASIVALRAPWIEPDPMPVRRDDASNLVERVRALGVSHAAILVSSHQSPLPLALLLRWAGVAHLAAVSHDHAGSLLDVRIPGDPDVHEVERGLLVTAALGMPALADDRLQVDLGPGAGDGRTLLGPVLEGRPYVVVHPGASAPARTLTPARWRAVVAALAATERTVVVTGSGEERGLTASVAGDHFRVSDVGGRLTLRQLGKLLASAAAVVVGNTGPMHMAAAVGTPVVAVFPPTVPLDRWRPWRVPHLVLGAQDVACAGCRSRACPLDEQVCLGAVGGDDVVAAVDRLEALTAARTGARTETAIHQDAGR